MTPTVSVTHDATGLALYEWTIAMGKTQRQAVDEGARRITRMVVALTPPASADVTGRDAFRQGEAKISRQVRSVLIPVKLKHKRKERWPDAETEYRKRASWRRSGVGVRVSRGPLIFVDERKVTALIKRKVAAVGRMASGWLAAASHLGVRTNAWVSRHGTSRGIVQVRDAGTQYALTVTNFAPGVPGNVRTEMARRVTYAFRYVGRGLRDNIWAAGLRAAGRLVPRSRRTGQSAGLTG